MSPLLVFNSLNGQSYEAFTLIDILTMEDCMSENSKIDLGNRAFAGMSHVSIEGSPKFLSWYEEHYGTTNP